MCFCYTAAHTAIPLAFFTLRLYPKSQIKILSAIDCCSRALGASTTPFGMQYSESTKLHTIKTDRKTLENRECEAVEERLGDRW